MGSWKMCLISKWAMFHFHDYGRKGTDCIPMIPRFLTNMENDVNKTAEQMLGWWFVDEPLL